MLYSLVLLLPLLLLKSLEEMAPEANPRHFNSISCIDIQGSSDRKRVLLDLALSRAMERVFVLCVKE